MNVSSSAMTSKSKEQNRMASKMLKQTYTEMGKQHLEQIKANEEKDKNENKALKKALFTKLGEKEYPTHKLQYAYNLLMSDDAIQTYDRQQLVDRAKERMDANTGTLRMDQIPLEAKTIDRVKTDFWGMCLKSMDARIRELSKTQIKEFYKSPTQAKAIVLWNAMITNNMKIPDWCTTYEDLAVLLGVRAEEVTSNALEDEHKGVPRLHLLHGIGERPMTPQDFMPYEVRPNKAGEAELVHHTLGCVKNLKVVLTPETLHRIRYVGNACKDLDVVVMIIPQTLEKAGVAYFDMESISTVGGKKKKLKNNTIRDVFRPDALQCMEPPHRRRGGGRIRREKVHPGNAAASGVRAEESVGTKENLPQRMPDGDAEDAQRPGEKRNMKQRDNAQTGNADKGGDGAANPHEKPPCPMDDGELGGEENGVDDDTTSEAPTTKGDGNESSGMQGLGGPEKGEMGEDDTLEVCDESGAKNQASLCRKK